MNKFNQNDFSEFEFSSILSANSVASNKSINQTLQNNTSATENASRYLSNNDSTNSSKISITIDNVDLSQLNYLDQEFNELGFESILSNKSNAINFGLLFQNSIESLDRLKRQISLNDRIQEK